jgi:SAM-dependent methyltransferase
MICFSTGTTDDAKPDAQAGEFRLHRHADGSSGDANYGVIARGYTLYRQPEPVIAEWIGKALGAAHTVLNVGAGAGSYEPVDRQVTAVEPSASMRAQRPTYLPEAIDAVAGSLPFAADAFDASMATFSVHQWPNLEAGLVEMRRVTTGPVLILSCDPDALHRSWLQEYAPEMIAVEARRYPSITAIQRALGGVADVISVPIPLNCTDGFSEAHYGRRNACWRMEQGEPTPPGASWIPLPSRASWNN